VIRHVNLGDWVNSECDRILNFRHWWRKQNKMDATQFPNLLSPSEWEQAFREFDPKEPGNHPRCTPRKATPAPAPLASLCLCEHPRPKSSVPVCAICDRYLRPENRIITRIRATPDDR